MNEHDLKHMIEATLLAAGRPVSSEQLLELFDERERPTSEQLRRRSNCSPPTTSRAASS